MSSYQKPPVKGGFFLYFSPNFNNSIIDSHVPSYYHKVSVCLQATGKAKVHNVNIIFFLTPKSEVAYIFEDDTLRQTIEKMEHRKFSCIPLLSVDGRYTGTISEGDLLWGLKRLNTMNVKEMEDISIMAIPRRATYKPVHADADMEDLLDRAINQNYVPVVDDQGFFIGIITRKEIIKYCYNELKKAYADKTTSDSEKHHTK